MNVTIKKSLSFLAVVFFGALIISLCMVSASKAVEIFNPGTFTHEDAEDNYDTFNKRQTSPDGQPAVEVENNTYSYERRYGAYVRGTSDVHYYRDHRLIMGNNNIPYGIVSIFADKGVDFELLDINGNVIGSSDNGIANKNYIKELSKTTYGNQDFYFIELKQVDFSGSTVPPEAYFFIKFYTTEATSQHYSLWSGQPLYGQSSVTKYVTHNLRKSSSIGSNVVSSKISSSITNVPTRSWVKSISYRTDYEFNSNYLSTGKVDHRIYFPGKSSFETLYGINSSRSFELNSITPKAYGTHGYQITGAMDYTAPVGATYTNSGGYTIQYYYMFGSKAA